jgi:hypothetical protein
MYTTKDRPEAVHLHSYRVDELISCSQRALKRKIPGLAISRGFRRLGEGRQHVLRRQSVICITESISSDGTTSPSARSAT